MTTTVSKYRSAYNYGANDKKNHNSYTNNSNWYLKAFALCYQYGFDGIEIDWDNIVECERAGSVPECGVSYNYLSGEYEKGLSVLRVKGEEEIASAMWFSERPTVTIKGIRLPFTGSDGETLILPLDIPEIDF